MFGLGQMGWGEAWADMNACEEMGHIPDKDNPDTCLDCLEKIPADAKIDPRYPNGVKSIDSKTTTTTTTTTTTPVKPEPRIYRPLCEFAAHLPVAPPENVRPEEPVGTGATSYGGYSGYGWV